MFNIFGQSWLRTPELIQSYHTALSSPTTDIKLVRNATDMITKDVSLIPVIEGLTGIAVQSYVMDAGILARGNQQYWNVEDTWLNK